MSEGRPAQKQLADSDGLQYKLRITPYRSNEGSTNGGVITVVDISSTPAVNNLLTLRGKGKGGCAPWSVNAATRPRVVSVFVSVAIMPVLPAPVNPSESVRPALRARRPSNSSLLPAPL